MAVRPFHRRWRRVAAALLLISALGAATPTQQGVAEPVDPLIVADGDFARHRDPALWRGLAVTRIAVEEGPVSWRFFRVANLARPDGPLWVVTHDNENATFAATLIALRSWGGVAMVVDTGADDSDRSARFNWLSGAAPIDPNRHFSDAHPIYTGTVLADLGRPARLIVALHSNEPGFDRRFRDCSGQPGAGAGDISIRLCSARFRPTLAPTRAWPFDDDDSLALVPHLANRPAESAWCGRALARAGFNVVFERVVSSDGSLSNYAAQHGLAYVNVETQERGSAPEGLAAARDRLVHMIDGVMAACGDIPALRLRSGR